MKTYFINPPSPSRYPIIRDVYRSGRTSKEGFIWPQTQLAELASFTKGKVKIIDCIAERISYKKLKSILHKEHPNHIVFEVIPATYSNDMRLATLAKEIGATWKTVGPHMVSVTIPDFDIDIKTMPTPRYDLLPLDKYRNRFFGKYIFVTVSRGCPFNCIFCRERVAFNGVHRVRPINKIIEDVRLLKKHNIDTFLFHAGVFTANKKWVLEFCRRIYPEKIRWACNTHIKTIDKEMAQYMKWAGCFMIAPGIESGNNRVLKTIRKEVDVDTIRDKVEMIAREGIEVWGYFIIGLPGEDKHTIEDTIRLSLQLPLTIAHFGIATPYFGTDFYKLCVRKGWLKPMVHWEDFDQNTKVMVKYPNLSARQIRGAVRKAYWKFYSRPKTLWMVARKLL